MPGQRGPVPVSKGSKPAAAASSGSSGDLTRRILDLLDEKSGPLHTDQEFPDVPQGEVKAALDRLGSRQMVQYQTKDTEQAVLTKEGQQISDEGSHEFKVWKAVKAAGKLPLKELEKHVGAGSAKFGQQNAMKNKWIKKDGSDLVPVADDVKDTRSEQLQEVAKTKTLSDAKVLADFKKTKLVTLSKAITYTVEKGPKFAKEIPNEVTDLTADMLRDGSWKTATFKAYNFHSMGAKTISGNFNGACHPLNKVREEFRKIFFYEGFTEMPTQRYVDSGFWNFDTLYVPQQHPARDLQDTFYVKDPAKADFPRDDEETEAYMKQMERKAQRRFKASGDTASKQGQPRNYKQYWNNIHAVHQDGAFGSIGYRYPWNADECLRLVLRTHTTSVSAWCLHRLAENPRPCKYFSIDKVFRNESVDATHLAEFHQIEGVIADYGLTLGGLQEFLADFFAELNITDLRFKPAYNPYTEPSMEVFGYHGGLGRWVEIGNSGMFRPEMLEPMGLPKDLRVYGFGLSLERPTMIKYALSNIRDLLGHKVDLSFVQDNAAVRLDR